MGQQVGNCKISHWPITWPIYLPCTVTQEQAHHESDIVSNSHLFYSKSINLPIPIIWLLKIWPWKSKVKVMGEVKVLSHNLSPTSYRLTFFWFHVNSPSYCYDKAFLKILPSKSKVKVIAHSHTLGITSYRLISLSFLVDQPFSNWDTAI